MGITQRNLDNRIFVLNQRYFKSVRKEFKELQYRDNKYKFNFKGKSDLYTFNELLKNISKRGRKIYQISI